MKEIQLTPETHEKCVHWYIISIAFIEMRKKRGKIMNRDKG